MAEPATAPDAGRAPAAAAEPATAPGQEAALPAPNAILNSEPVQALMAEIAKGDVYIGGSGDKAPKDPKVANSLLKGFAAVLDLDISQVSSQKEKVQILQGYLVENIDKIIASGGLPEGVTKENVLSQLHDGVLGEVTLAMAERAAAIAVADRKVKDARLKEVIDSRPSARGETGDAAVAAPVQGETGGPRQPAPPPQATDPATPAQKLAAVRKLVDDAPQNIDKDQLATAVFAASAVSGYDSAKIVPFLRKNQWQLPQFDESKVLEFLNSSKSSAGQDLARRIDKVLAMKRDNMPFYQIPMFALADLINRTPATPTPTP